MFAMNTFRFLFIFIFCLGFDLHAQSAPPLSPFEQKIVLQGVPKPAVTYLFDFLAKHEGQAMSTPTYICRRHPLSVKPCKMKERAPSTQTLILKPQRYAIIVDFSLSSLEKRMYLIDMTSGQVEKFRAAHGKGSGDGLYAVRFGDELDSKETALGMYMTGAVYKGDHGMTLRLYGLEDTNQNAYRRDIVLHGAPYMKADFALKINPKTHQPYGRMGVSWGCPAVEPSVAKTIIPLIANGSLVYHYVNPTVPPGVQTAKSQP